MVNELLGDLTNELDPHPLLALALSRQRDGGTACQLEDMASFLCTCKSAAGQPWSALEEHTAHCRHSPELKQRNGTLEPVVGDQQLGDDEKVVEQVQADLAREGDAHALLELHESAVFNPASVRLNEVLNKLSANASLRMAAGGDHLAFATKGEVQLVDTVNLLREVHTVIDVVCNLLDHLECSAEAVIVHMGIPRMKEEVLQQQRISRDPLHRHDEVCL